MRDAPAVQLVDHRQPRIQIGQVHRLGKGVVTYTRRAQGRIPHQGDAIRRGLSGFGVGRTVCQVVIDMQPTIGVKGKIEDRGIPAHPIIDTAGTNLCGMGESNPSIGPNTA